jgi:hypothetical protein
MIEPDQYDVTVVDPAQVYALGDDRVIRGTIFVIAKAGNAGRPRFGITSKLAGTSSGRLMSREDTIVLENPNGIQLSKYGITGGSANDGVTVIHGGGFTATEGWPA